MKKTAKKVNLQRRLSTIRRANPGERQFVTLKELLAFKG